MRYGWAVIFAEASLLTPPRRLNRRSPSNPDRPPKSDEAQTILQFRFWLKGLSPMVWRRVEVPATMALREFHGVLQVAMGWEGIHLYQFVVHTIRYGSWELTAGSPDIGLDTLKLREGSRFLYEYDLNVPWEHEVRLEEWRAAKPKTHYPCCTGGDGNCPPEDSGGPESWMRRKDEALGLEMDEDLVTALEFIQEISDTQSLAILENSARTTELRELFFRIEGHAGLLGKPFERRNVNERLRRDDHLTRMYQQM